jgi:hypothetical protein
MRPILLAAAALLVVPLAACSSGGSTTAAGTSSAPAPASSAASTPSDSGSTPASGSGDCSALTKDDMAKYIVYTQIVAQVRDAGMIDTIKSGTLTDYTPDKLDAILAKMSFLQGDGATAVQFFQKADASIAAMLSGTPTAADFAAYQKQTGGIAGVLKQQLAINLAIGTTCPNLG